MKISALVLSFFIGVLSTNIYTYFMSSDQAQTNCLENSNDNYPTDVTDVEVAQTDSVEQVPTGLQLNDECVFCNMMKVPLAKRSPATVTFATVAPSPITAEIEYSAEVVTNATAE